MPPKSTLLILNGKFADDPEIQQAIVALQDEGFAIQPRPTRADGDAARLAAEAVRDGFERVIACGGDGTVNEVLNGLFSETDQPTTALGIVPMGTANDFATGCGIITDDPHSAIRTALEAPARPVDVGRINDRLFLNAISMGFGAEVTATTPRPLKQALGGAAYSIQALLSVGNLEPIRVRLIGDDMPSGEVALYLAAIANGCQAGGGYQVAPDARIDDGRLNMMLVRETPAAEIPALIAEWQDPGNPNNTHIITRTLTRVRIEADEDLHLTIDGDLDTGRGFDIRILPGCLRLVLRRETPPGPAGDA